GSSVSSNGGAGSGGSVWLRVNTLSGTGAISADGGNGRSGYYGSGGGGGRIAVYYTQNEGFELSNITSTGGLGGYRTESAGAGTIYLVDESRQSRQLHLVGQDREGRATFIAGEP